MVLSGKKNELLSLNLTKYSFRIFSVHSMNWYFGVRQSPFSWNYFDIFIYSEFNLFIFIVKILSEKIITVKESLGIHAYKIVKLARISSSLKFLIKTLNFFNVFLRQLWIRPDKQFDNIFFIECDIMNCCYYNYVSSQQKVKISVWISSDTKYIRLTDFKKVTIFFWI